MTGAASAKITGFGLGLRKEHYAAILEHGAAVDWFEALTENYMIDGGWPLYVLERVRADYPLVLHGVSLSIGGVDPLDRDYLERLRALCRRFEPAWVSDHLCWTSFRGANYHDLLPLPFTEECLRHVSERVHRVQELLGRQILLENVSSYVSAAHSTLHEADFLAALCDATECNLLLDVNNVYVSACNHGFDALDYLHRIPVERVRQIHLAGHTDGGGILIDTHDRAICDAVWQLYAAAVRRFGSVPTMIERDDDLPPLATLLAELDRARAIDAMVAGTERLVATG